MNDLKDTPQNKITKQTKNTYSKPRVGIFSLTSCDGCQMQILNLEDDLLDLANSVDIVNFALAQQINDEGKLDVCLVEGAVSNDREVKIIKKLRKRSKILVAFGTCAVFGGIPSIKNLKDKEKIKKLVYGKGSEFISSINATGLDEYVKVDYYLRGCPVNKNEFLNFVQGIIFSRPPVEDNNPVCYECKLNENDCLLLKGEYCVGPITFGGCNAICIENNVACTGCRGPIVDANVNEMVLILKKLGANKKITEQLLQKFAAHLKKLQEIDYGNT